VTIRARLDHGDDFGTFTGVAGEQVGEIGHRRRAGNHRVDVDVVVLPVEFDRR
jgi:hypothetical protein